MASKTPSSSASSKKVTPPPPSEPDDYDQDIEFLKEKLKDAEAFAREQRIQQQRLLERLAALEQRGTVAVAAGPPPAPPIAKPDKFDGTQNKLRGFLTQMKAYLRQQGLHLRPESEQVLTAAGYLSGNALAWFEPTLRDFLETNDAAWQPDTLEAFGSYKGFEDLMKATFGEPDEERTYTGKLEKLRQTHSVSKYAAEFKQIAAHLQWEDKPLMDKFYRGLKDDVKDELYKQDVPGRLTEYIEMAVRIDNRLYMRKMERQGKYYQKHHQHQKYAPNTSKRRNGSTAWGTHAGPMELDGTQQKNGTRNFHKKKGKCYNCGKEGHFARECKSQRKEGARNNQRQNFAATDNNPNFIPVPDVRGLAATENSHASLSWTACYDDQCTTHKANKEDSGWYPKKPVGRATIAATQHDDDLFDEEQTLGATDDDEENMDEHGNVNFYTRAKRWVHQQLRQNGTQQDIAVLYYQYYHDHQNHLRWHLTEPGEDEEALRVWEAVRYCAEPTQRLKPEDDFDRHLWKYAYHRQTPEEIQRCVNAWSHKRLGSPEDPSTEDDATEGLERPPRYSRISVRGRESSDSETEEDAVPATQHLVDTLQRLEDKVDDLMEEQKRMRISSRYPVIPEEEEILDTLKHVQEQNNEISDNLYKVMRDLNRETFQKQKRKWDRWNNELKQVLQAAPESPKSDEDSAGPSSSRKKRNAKGKKTLAATTGRKGRLHLTQKIRLNGHEVTAMIDSGAQGNYISPRIVNSKKIPNQEKNDPYQVTSLDGSPIAYQGGVVAFETAQLEMTIKEHTESIQFDVTNTGRHDVVLGLPWLRTSNPRIDWATDQLWWSKTE